MHCGTSPEDDPKQYAAPPPKRKRRNKPGHFYYITHDDDINLKLILKSMKGIQDVKRFVETQVG